METADLNLRITFQRPSGRTGSHAYKDFYSDWATVSDLGETVDFTVCRDWMVRAVTSDGWRIVAGNDTYNVLSVDPMANRGTCFKFHCKKI